MCDFLLAFREVTMHGLILYRFEIQRDTGWRLWIIHIPSAFSVPSYIHVVIKQVRWWSLATLTQYSTVTWPTAYRRTFRLVRKWRMKQVQMIIYFIAVYLALLSRSFRQELEVKAVAVDFAHEQQRRRLFGKWAYDSLTSCKPWFRGTQPSMTSYLAVRRTRD